MDLVHKENVVFAEIGQQRRQIAGLFNGRAGGDADVDAHLGGDDARQRGLAQTRRAVEQHMVQRLRPPPGGLDKDGEILLGLGLADVLRQCMGAQAHLRIVLRQQRLGYQRLLVDIGAEINAHTSPPFSCFSCHFTIFFSACRMISSSGRASISMPFRAVLIS